MQAKIFSFEPKGGAGYACKYTLKPSLGGLNPVSVSPVVLCVLHIIVKDEFSNFIQ
jgi:hypothetical protein